MVDAIADLRSAGIGEAAAGADAGPPPLARFAPASWAIDGAFAVNDIPALMTDTQAVHVVLAPRGLSRRAPSTTLSAQEIGRAERFRQAADRERFIVAHETARRVLAGLFGQDPAALRIEIREGGKPYVPGAALDFSLSHSGEWTAVAVRRDAAVGIDVEQARPTPPHVPMSLVLHPEDLRRVPPGLADDAFFLNWTVKEAIAKAAGLGLAMPFPAIRLHATGPGACLGRVDDASQWPARHGRLVDGAHLALASAAPLTRVRTFFARDW